jgi:tRNA 2-thiouridine synthesizing protein E
MALATRILTDAQFNEEGFLTDPYAWTEELAEEIAEREGIALTDRHWVVINFARREFEVTGQAPTLRKITKQSGVDTKEMYALFPGGPAKMAAKIAGLGKPTGCI